jgi:sulfate permease, SulP family
VTVSRHSILGDVYGGITAAVVALPLALAFGVASGLGPIAGLHGAIAVGFFATVFGGTSAQVSGPTGPMTVVMGAVVAQHADRLETAFAIVFLGGAMQVLFGLSRVGRYIAYTPYSVISGFMSGIGVIIIIMQLLPMFGAPGDAPGPVAALLALPTAVMQINLHALAIAVTALAIMTLWPERLGRIMPAPLAALLAGSFLGLLLLEQAPVIGQVPTGLPTLQLPVFPLDDLGRILQPAFVLALLGSIDSLLTSLVADSITRTRHDSNRELLGQGIGNMAAGLIGALPGAGATMRTVVNVRAGGRTRRSGALHAVVLLALALGLAPLAERIPHAVLAGILLKVGWDIIDWGFLKRVAQAPREKVIVMFVTFGLTVFVDLITAVAVGLIIAAFVTAEWMAEEELRRVKQSSSGNHTGLSEKQLQRLEELGSRVFIVHMDGYFSYASARGLTHQIGMMTPGHEVLILDLGQTSRIDVTAAMAVDEVVTTAHFEGLHVILSGINGSTRAVLDSLGVLARMAEDQLSKDLDEAIELAVSQVHDTLRSCPKGG